MSGAQLKGIVGGGAALVALALAAVFWMTRAGPESAAAAPDGAGSRAEPTAGPGAALAVPASVPEASSPSAAPATPPAWSEVPMSARLSDLGPALARPVYDGLKNARTAMEPCFRADEKEKAAHPRAADGEAWGAAIVTLQLEGRPGELVIVNAPLQELGTSTPSLVDCCEGVLRGFRIPAPGAIPGKRYRLQHQLVQ